MQWIRSVSAERSVAGGLALLLAFSFVAGVPAAQTVLMALVGVIAIVTACRHREGLRDAVSPRLGRAWLCWCVIASASSIWSPAPVRSIEAAMLSCWLPGVCCLAAAYAARAESARRVMMYGMLIGLTWLYGAMASIVLLGHASALRTASGSDIGSSYGFLVRWYPGPGLASTFILLAMPMLVWAAAAGLISKRASALFVGLGLVCGALTYNRMFWLGGVVLVLALGLGASHATLSGDRVLRALAALLVSLALLAVALVVTTVLRHNYGFGWSGLHDSFVIISSDLRFMIWREWLAIGERAPLLGAGFGKMPAALAYRDLIQQGIARGMTPVANVHPHNLFLSVWIQTGVVGLAGFLWLLVALVREWVWPGGRVPRQIVLAGLSLVAMLVLKNSTDDFYDKAVPVVFWTFAGVLLGVAHSSLQASSLTRN